MYSKIILFQIFILNLIPIQAHFPPSQIIGPISKREETDSQFKIEFTALSGDPTQNPSVSILTYQACCSAQENPTEKDCQADSLNCAPISTPGTSQTCLGDKFTLAKLFASSNLTCGVRPVNTASELGIISQQFISVDVSIALEEWLETEVDEIQSCTKFSLEDKCLPIWIFWVAIGCLALLVFILLIFIICCCIRFKKQKTKKPEISLEEIPQKPVNPVPTPNQNLNRPEEEPKVVKELFVNHAYIQDDSGDIKIIANNGQILRRPKEENRPERNFTENQNMPVFKPEPAPKPQNLSKTRRQVKTRRPEILHANPMLRSDSQFDISFQPQAPQGFPTGENPTLSYATISRNSRLKPVPNARQIQPNHFDPHYSVPRHSTFNPQIPPKPVISRHPKIPSSPPQMPHYPTTTISSSPSSSDNEARMQRRVPPRFKKPPAYPQGSSKGVQLPGLVPVPPPRYDRRIVASPHPPHQNVNRMQSYSGRNVERYEDEDSDEWDDGDNTFELDYNTGISHA